MYLNGDMDGFSESLKKVRAVVHKIFPRELSPSRLAEKYGSDAKKKGAKKLAAVSSEVDAHTAAGNALLQMQMDTLNAAAPQNVLPVEIAADFAPREPPRIVAPNWTPWVLGGTLAFLAFSIVRRRTR